MCEVFEMKTRRVTGKRELIKPKQRTGAWQKHKTQGTDDFVIGANCGDTRVGVQGYGIDHQPMEAPMMFAQICLN
jgi:hypothetical protein